MRVFRAVLMVSLATAGCVSSRREPAARPDDDAAVRAELIRMGEEDQRERAGFGAAIAAKDTAYARRLIAADSARSTRLREIIRELGWPRRSRFGREAASAAWLILQHTPYQGFQREMLPHLEALAQTGDIHAADVAMLTDRVLVGEGKPQRYGTQFAIIGQRMEPNPVENLSQVDSLRATVGLMPMAEYVRMMEEMYKLPVTWPPKPRTSP